MHKKGPRGQSLLSKLSLMCSNSWINHISRRRTGGSNLNSLTMFTDPLVCRAFLVLSHCFDELFETIKFPVDIITIKGAYHGRRGALRNLTEEEAAEAGDISVCLSTCLVPLNTVYTAWHVCLQCSGIGNNIRIHVKFLLRTAGLSK